MADQAGEAQDWKARFSAARRRVTYRAFGWLSAIGSLCTIAMTIAALAGSLAPWVFAIGFVAFSVTLIGLVLYTTGARRTAELKLEHSRGDSRVLEEGKRSLEEHIRGLEARLEAGSKAFGSHRLAFGDIHRMVHELRDYLYEADVSDWDGEERRRELYRVAVGILGDVSAMMTRLTGRTCATCVKLFVDPPDASNEDGTLITFCRDRESARTRGQRDRQETFQVSENHDFSRIVHSDENFFTSNDLSGHEGYYNERPDWRSRYLSALVLPIQRSNIGDEPERFHDILGFLCVDAKETQVFDESFSVELLAPISDSMYWPLHLMHQATRRETPDGPEDDDG